MAVFYFDAWCFPWNNDQDNYNITFENTYNFVVINSTSLSHNTL